LAGCQLFWLARLLPWLGGWPCRQDQTSFPFAGLCDPGCLTGLLGRFPGQAALGCLRFRLAGWQMGRLSWLPGWLDIANLEFARIAPQMSSWLGFLAWAQRLQICAGTHSGC